MVRKRKSKAKILGIGLDGADGHVRVTRSENMDLLGGSEQTHSRMQETCIKFNEKLDCRGRKLADLEHNELRDMASECGMNLLLPDERPG